MIKVVSFTADSWHEVSPNAYTSSYLDKLLDEGWKIKDWKMAMGQYNRGWTFILEKESNQNNHIKKINDGCLQVYHWQFISDSQNEYHVNVYETRSGDVIGILTNRITNDIALQEIEKTLSNFSENEVYNWINDNVEYI